MLASFLGIYYDDKRHTVVKKLLHRREAHGEVTEFLREILWNFSVGLCGVSV